MELVLDLAFQQEDYLLHWSFYDMRICVVSLLLRISGSKLYLHRTNETLLIC